MVRRSERVIRLNAASPSAVRTATASSEEGNNEPEVPANPQGSDVHVAVGQGGSVGDAGGGAGSARQAASVGGQNAGAQQAEPLGQVLLALTQLLSRFPAVAAAPAPGEVPPVERAPVEGERIPPYLTMLEMMGKLGTRRFSGESDPVKADEWRSRLERNFASIRCPEGYKKDIAVHFLGEEANNWWLGVSGSMRNPDCSWEEFLAAFRAKYFPPEAAERLENEFLALRQGTKSVRELEAEFNRLKRHAGRDLSVEAEIRAFMRCLRIELRNRVVTRKVETLTELVEVAATLESGLAEEARLASRAKTPLIPVQAAKTGVVSQKKRKFSQIQGGGQSTPARAPCGKCGKMHPGPCRLGAPGCFRCGASDHMLRECKQPALCFQCGEPGHTKATCPKLAQGGNQPASRRSAPVAAATPRVYTIEDGQVGASSSRPISG